MNTLTQSSLQQAFETLMQAERILIVAHQKPDGDTSGSSLSLWHWLTNLGKEVHIYCRHEIPDQFSFMPMAHIAVTDESLFSREWDALVTCDSGDLEYAGIAHLMDQLPKKPATVNFDHHPSNKLFADINLVDVSASSTAEVVYHFFNTHDIDITQEIAVCLMTGVFTDTGGFSNASTNQHALQMASDFVQKGASIPDIHRATIANKDIHSMKLWGKVFSRLRETEQGIAFTYILQKDLHESGLDQESIEGMSNYLSQLRDAKAIMVFSEREGNIVKASMRTYHDDIDLSVLAAAVGGGGHQKAAGFTIPGRIVETADGVRVE